MSFNIKIITALRNISNKKLKSKCYMYVVMCMLSKINYKKENISADLVIWIKNKHYSRDSTNSICFLFFSIMTSRGLA